MIILAKIFKFVKFYVVRLHKFCLFYAVRLHIIGKIIEIGNFKSFRPI